MPDKKMRIVIASDHFGRLLKTRSLSTSKTAATILLIWV